MARPSGVLGTALALLGLGLGSAYAHSLSGKTLRFSYGGTMQRCALSGPCDTLPFQPITGTVYLSDDKVYDFGLDKSGTGVDLGSSHDLPGGGGKKIAVVYAVAGQRFITTYNISDESGTPLSVVAITISTHGERCSIDYDQRQPGYRFSPRIAVRSCSVVTGKPEN